MVMHRPSGTGVVGRSDLCHRADAHWSGLVMFFETVHIVHAHEPEEARWRSKFSVARQASQSAQSASFERERQELTRATPVPKNGATLRELRARRLQSDFAPEEGVKFGCQVVRDMFEVCAFRIVSRSRRCTTEMLRVSLDDQRCCI